MEELFVEPLHWMFVFFGWFSLELAQEENPVPRNRAWLQRFSAGRNKGARQAFAKPQEEVLQNFTRRVAYPVA
jgi:hypothetical protein